MDIAIVDDTLSCANMVQKEVKKYFPLDVMQVFLTNFEELLTSSFDICFIDIRLAEIDGIQLAIQYSKRYPKCKIVFISNYDNLIYDSIITNLFFFVRKNNIDEDMQRFYKKYVTFLEERSRIIEVISNRNKVSLCIKDILYIVVSKNHCYIHTVDNSCYEIYSSLSKILEEIDSINFCQINHNMVINIEYIKQVIGNKILMSDNTEMEVTRRKRKEFIEKYKNKLLHSN